MTETSSVETSSAEANNAETQEVTTWYLEMKSASALKPARKPYGETRVERVLNPTAAFVRYLYTAVGGDWHWTDRLFWSKADWEAHLARTGVEIYTLQTDGAPVGYVELDRQAEGDVELAYFGLIPEFMGRGLGGWLLTRAVELAWHPIPTQRLWVHSCSLDTPHALANYQARGFTIYRTETHTCRIRLTPGPWPNWKGHSQ